jgi:hypothetical protein
MFSACLSVQVPYLQEHYRGYGGPRGFPFKARGLVLLALEMWRGNPPPAPYSRGMAENLNIFFYAPKPYSYRQVDEDISEKL